MEIATFKEWLLLKSLLVVSLWTIGDKMMVSWSLPCILLLGIKDKRQLFLSSLDFSGQYMVGFCLGVFVGFLLLLFFFLG